MKNKILSVLVLMSFLLFQGCKDDEGTSTPTSTKTKTELISACPWILTGVTVSPGVDDGTGTIITDLYEGDEPCDDDDATVFKADGTGVYTEGATKCDPADPQEYGTFTWSFNADETKLTEDGYTSDIGELSTSRLVLLENVDGDEIDGGVSGTTYKLSIIYTH